MTGTEFGTSHALISKNVLGKVGGLRDSSLQCACRDRVGVRFVELPCPRAGEQTTQNAAHHFRDDRWFALARGVQRSGCFAHEQKERKSYGRSRAEENVLARETGGKARSAHAVYVDSYGEERANLWQSREE